MSTIRRPALVAAAAAVLVTAGTVTAAAAGGADSAAASRANVLHFGVRFSPFTVIDVPPVQTGEGDFRPGDYTVFSDVLTDKAGHAVGVEGGTGMITLVSSTDVQLNYNLTVRLPAGQIVAQGLGTPAPDKHLAVVGGTGSFTGAAGRFDLVENGDGTGSLTITLR
jgi:hypothetical protein